MAEFPDPAGSARAAAPGPSMGRGGCGASSRRPTPAREGPKKPLGVALSRSLRARLPCTMHLPPLPVARRATLRVRCTAGCLPACVPSCPRACVPACLRACVRTSARLSFAVWQCTASYRTLKHQSCGGGSGPIYVSIYLCIYLSISLYLSIYPCIHPSIYVCIYLSIYLRTPPGTCGPPARPRKGTMEDDGDDMDDQEDRCAHICICICICICMYIYIYIHVYEGDCLHINPVTHMGLI